jgi:ABC-type multidrug transport system ATPase subunit
MAMPAAEKRQRVAKVLDELSLTRCADQRVGNVDRRGLSGGERKRASIALELLVNPSVLFVDEPTSGLDSKMAEDVVLTLKRLAQQGIDEATFTSHLRSVAKRPAPRQSPAPIAPAARNSAPGIGGGW